jgi:hypothetical protein
MNITVEESPSGNSKSSMVNALLKTVTGEINRSRAAQTQLHVLKSPSPRKRRYNPADHLSGSPKRWSSSSKSTPPPPPLQFPGAVKAPQESGTADNSSDYGDDDFDDDALMHLDAGISPAQEHEPTGPQPQNPETGQDVNPNITAQDLDALEDEFDDLDDDIFAAAGDLLSHIDNPCNTGQHTTVPQAPVAVDPDSLAPVSDDLAEDLYGDDFGGDFDFEAAEMAATQSVKPLNGSVPLVRRSWQPRPVVFSLKHGVDIPET